MLSSLSIRDVVLVEALDLEIRDGLTVLTGETGAGKSIILDALGLALGGRGDAGLVRSGAKHAVATAVFTAPEDPKAKKKDRWLFTWPEHDWFGIAGIVRADPKVGEAFTMLTCPPGPDVEPYHNRQVVLLSPEDCLGWLDPAGVAESFVHPLPAGSLEVTRA